MIKKTYSFTKDGKQNDVYTLKNAQGVEVDILTYGARILRVFVPDRKGKFSDGTAEKRENPRLGFSFIQTQNKLSTFKTILLCLRLHQHESH